MTVLAFGIARNILKKDSRDRERMRIYANALSEFHIVVLTRKDHGFNDDIHDGNLHIYPTNSNTKVGMLIDAKNIGIEIAKKANTGKLVISAQDPLEMGWVAWIISRKIKSILHIQLHGDYFGKNWCKKSLILKLKQKMALVLLKKTTVIRAVSHRIKDSLIKKGIEEEKIKVLPIRPEFENFLVLGHSFRSEPPLTFIYVGRFSKEKDITRIIEAFAMVYKTNTNIRLKLVGIGSEEKNIKSCINSNEISDVVEIVEWTENVPEVMNSADVLLLASKHEAYGLVLLEAMAVGLPIISTDVGCVGEVVKDGVHGIIVREEGANSYADAIQKILEDTDIRKTYGENGRKTAEKIAEKSMDDYVNEWVNSMSHTH